MNFSEVKKGSQLRHKLSPPTLPYWIEEVWDHGALICWKLELNTYRAYMLPTNFEYYDIAPPPPPPSIKKLKYQIVWAYNPATREVNAVFGKFDTALQDATHVYSKDMTNKYHVLRVDTVEYDGEVK